MVRLPFLFVKVPFRVVLLSKKGGRFECVVPSIREGSSFFLRFLIPMGMRRVVPG